MTVRRYSDAKRLAGPACHPERSEGSPSHVRSAFCAGDSSLRSE